MRRSLLSTALCAAVLLGAGCVPPDGPPPNTTTTTSTTSTSLVPPPPAHAVAVEAGTAHACALASDATVSCWGLNTYGELGVATNVGTGTPNPTPQQVPGLTDVVAISAGDFHTCALTNDGLVRCWGLNAYGQLGNHVNTGLADPNPTPTIVDGLVGVVALSAGGMHSCAITELEGVWCWGLNVYGQLGRTANTVTTTPNPDPLPVNQTVGAVSVSTSSSSLGFGGGHTCAVLGTGEMSCWGHNVEGQLGNPTNVNTFTAVTSPVAVTGITGVASATAGFQHECALLNSGDVWCWGNGGLGQAGPNDFGPPWPTPAHVDGVSGAVAIAAGQSHTCAVLTGGTMSCWGSNVYGETGSDPSITPPTQGNSTPVPVPGITGATVVAADSEFTCAIHGAGAVSCWGRNNYGQLGNTTNLGTLAPNPTPLSVIGFP